MMLKHYIIEKQNNLKNKTVDFYTPTGLHVFFQHPVENVDVEKVINQVENTIPHHLLSEVEMIIFGWFDEFEERSINAFYNDNALYISHLQEDEKDLFDDIVHEISHSLENPYGYQIYADDKIKDEFLRKRIHLHDILWKSGYRAPKAFFMDTEYNEEFDMFLYEKIGYDKLSVFVQGLFLNPYAATSLREYFATGFTEFFVESEHAFMEKVSPALYQKLIKMQNPIELDI
jgi:hypothetical protein